MELLSILGTTIKREAEKEGWFNEETQEQLKAGKHSFHRENRNSKPPV